MRGPHFGGLSSENATLPPSAAGESKRLTSTAQPEPTPAIDGLRRPAHTS